MGKTKKIIFLHTSNNIEGLEERASQCGGGEPISTIFQ